MKPDRRRQLLARHNLEDLATRCLSAAVMALLRESSFDEAFDWRAAGGVAVDMAVAIRVRAGEVTGSFSEQELELFAERYIAAGAEAPS